MLQQLQNFHYSFKIYFTRTQDLKYNQKTKKKLKNKSKFVIWSEKSTTSERWHLVDACFFRYGLIQFWGPIKNAHVHWDQVFS